MEEKMKIQILVCSQCKRSYIPTLSDPDYGTVNFCGNICMTQYFAPKFNLKKLREEQGGEYGTDLESEKYRDNED